MKEPHGQKSCPFLFRRDMDKKVFRSFELYRTNLWICYITINIQFFFQMFVYKNILKRLLSLTAANFLQNIILIKRNLYQLKQTFLHNVHRNDTPAAFP